MILKIIISFSKGEMKAASLILSRAAGSTMSLKHRKEDSRRKETLLKTVIYFLFQAEKEALRHLQLRHVEAPPSIPGKDTQTLDKF